MVLSKREKIIVILTMLVLMIFIMDRFVVTPFMNSKESIRLEKQGLVNEMQDATRLFKHKKRIKSEWQEMINGGLEKDPSGIESKVLHVIRQLSQDCGLTISSIKPDRNRNESRILKEIVFNLSCKGGMNSVGQFLWEIENSTLPLKITEFQLGAREEDGRDMSLQMKLSAVYLPEEDKKGDENEQEQKGDA